MNNTEIFELCETSSKQQCLDCNLYWEVGIVYCTCGRCIRVSQSAKEVDKSNDDVLSIPGDVIKKNNKRGARQEMLHKARQEKHGNHSFILAKGNNDYKKSLSQMDGQRSIQCFLTKLRWRIIHTSQQELREFDIQNIGSNVRRN